jgi:hypothetical protein
MKNLHMTKKKIKNKRKRIEKNAKNILNPFDV